MSRASRAHSKRGGPEVARTGKDGDQTFATLKFVFPRGDATSLLFGFDAAGKVTGVALRGLAGD
jgi:hypothetical protein